MKLDSVQTPLSLDGGIPKNGSIRYKAVITCHGMGSQIPYETIEGVVKPLDHFEYLNGVEIKVRMVESKERRFGRAEVTNGETEVHFYEVYWSPQTAGKITLFEVVAFLGEASFNGVRFSLKRFDRFIFNRRVEFNGGWSSLGSIIKIISILFSLIAPCVCLLASVFAFSVNLFGHVEPKNLELYSWLGLISVYTLIIVGYGCKAVGTFWVKIYSYIRICAIIFQTIYDATTKQTTGFGAKIGRALRTYFRNNPEKEAALRNWIDEGRSSPKALSEEDIAIKSKRKKRIGSGLMLLALIGCFGLVNVPLVAILIKLLAPNANIAVGLASLPPQYSEINASIEDLNNFLDFTMSIVKWLFVHKTFGAIFYFFSFAAFYKLITVFRDYVGDVAIYLSAHEANRFWEVRDAITNNSRNLAEAVFLSKDENGDLFYDEVVFVGHSLGSVISYDLLNWCLYKDELKGQFKSKQRIKALVTFGSPLDKTAFLFRTQSARTIGIREALSSATQPLILDPIYETISWINIWSPEDVISGKLEFYDQPVGQGGKSRITNIIDFYANVPFVAHIQFWKNHLLGQVLEFFLFNQAARSKPLPK